MSKDFIVLTSRNEKLRVTAYGENNLENAPCLICVHGFKGFKDWGFWPYTGEYFANNGFFVLTFNFSHNGIGENLTEFTEIEKFAQNTFSLEVEELTELVSAYRNGFFGNRTNGKIGLLGHSRGGAVSLLAASGIAEVNAITVWASVAKLDRYSERQKEVWLKKRVFEVLNTRTNQVMRLNISLLNDIEKNKGDLLNIEKALKNLNRPLLIVHGEQDLAVPISEAELIFDWADKQKTSFIKIPAAGHTFDIVHPFAGTNVKFENLLVQTTQFFKTNLS